MKITVCELRNDLGVLEEEWRGLAGHVRSEGSELVLLPEMPFYAWLARSKEVKAGEWRAAVAAHEAWMGRLVELAPAAVLTTRPVIRNGKHLNEAFIWDATAGYRAVHHKYYLPDEEGWYEASWYERGEKDFSSVEWNGIRIGFLICTELWFNFHAREYMKQGIELLVCPRATGKASADKWIAGGRTAAVVSGAHCLSSNFASREGSGIQWAGMGWIIDPEAGDVLGLTSSQEPFLTVDIDLSRAANAKHTYPRYVSD